jgi:hypothetical protein
MEPDLEHRIRAALRERGASVLPQRTEQRTDSERRPHRWAPPLLAAAAVVILAIAVAVAVSVGRGSGSDPGTPAAGGAPAYAGYEWRVVSLQDRHGVLSVPPDIDATVAFGRDGALYGSDTVNSLSATYVPGDTAYTVENPSSTLVGYSGGDPTRVRVIAAVNALFFSGSAGPPGGPVQVTIVAKVQGDSLTLRTTGTEIITVNLDREQPPLATPTAAPSETSTGSSPSETPASGSDLPSNAPGSTYASEVPDSRSATG